MLDELTRGLTLRRPIHAYDGGAALLVVPGADALRAWHDLAAAAPARGMWPIMLGADADELEGIFTGDFVADAQRSLREAEELQASNARAEAQQLHLPDGALLDWIAMHPKGGPIESLREALAAPRTSLVGPVPTPPLGKPSPPLDAPTILFDPATDRLAVEQTIALVPSPTPWHALAYFPLGGYNAMPGPRVHLVTHRRFFDRFGAEVCGLTASTIDCRVQRPPATAALAFELARELEQYSEQTKPYGSTAQRAASLMRSPYWSFSWD